MRSRRHGFTLIELMIVMVIIGILLSLILRAYMGGVRIAEEKATIALIAKLDTAMSDRMDAVTTYQANPTLAHASLASLNAGTAGRAESAQRAQVIAQFDYLRGQLPDVFAVQSVASSTAGLYPLNFAATAWGSNGDWRDFVLPLGAFAEGKPVEGMYGASFEISSGIYKQLGYSPAGYDGNDNNSDGAVDDALEGLSGLSASEVQTINTRLAKHTHRTARAEMLYAILVEGSGPYGSSFNKDDFTDKEVRDTDGDGLMEFVDAWGEPLQFYRWPILYRSDSQKGHPDVAKLVQDQNASLTPGPYTSVYENREQNPLDPNQTLLAPAWWGWQYNSSTFFAGANPSLNISGSAATFMSHFGPCLVDPIVVSRATPAPSSATYWDRSTASSPGSTGPLFARRAYYSRFLILSGGPDKETGTARLLDTKDKRPAAYITLDDRSTISTPSGTVPGPDAISGNARDGSGAGAAITVPNMLIESQGGRVDPVRDTSLFGKLGTMGADGRNDTNSLLEYFGADDVTNQNLQSTGGVLR